MRVLRGYFDDWSSFVLAGWTAYNIVIAIVDGDVTMTTMSAVAVTLATFFAQVPITVYTGRIDKMKVEMEGLRDALDDCLLTGDRGSW